jgi:LCP family protein required for cell wall assembly
MMSDLLESLDDPIPYSPSPNLAGAARTRGRQLRRRRRLGVSAGAMPIVLVLALVAGAIYVDRRVAGVARVDIAAGVLTPAAAGVPYNILVIGTDGPRLDAPDVVGERSDTMIVVHVDQAAGRLSLLSLPRDLVFAGATSGADRINAVLPRSGAAGLIATIHDHLGIDIAHYVRVDFRGFVRLIDAAGGVSVRASAPLRDANTGMTLDASCQRLDGERTLGLVRSRHVEFQSKGRWTNDPTSDLGRMDRQRVVLSLLVGQLAQLPHDPATLGHLLDVFENNTTIDSGFSQSTLLDLARWGRALQPDAIESETLPVATETLPDGANVLTPTADSPAAVSAFTGGEVARPAAGGITGVPPFTIAGC